METSPPKKVLYIEDNQVNIYLVQAILNLRPNVQLLTATSGTTGLEMARQQHPDLILLDLSLPDMQDDECLRQLRSIEALAKVPIVIVSAKALDEHDTNFSGLGVADYLAKPFELTRFEQMIDLYISH